MELVGGLKQKMAWFPTCRDAVSWFRLRRSVTFESIRGDDNAVRVKASPSHAADLPGLMLRVYTPPAVNGRARNDFEGHGPFSEVAFTRAVDARPSALAARS
jgi:hypothetical protein